MNSVTVRPTACDNYSRRPLAEAHNPLALFHLHYR